MSTILSEKNIKLQSWILCISIIEESLEHIKNSMVDRTDYKDSAINELVKGSNYSIENHHTQILILLNNLKYKFKKELEHGKL